MSHIDTSPMRFTDLDGNPLELVLYKYDACPYCRMVDQAIARLGWQISVADTLRHPDNRRELIALGGRSQVPCLLINGEPLYESQDIIHYLQTQMKSI